MHLQSLALGICCGFLPLNFVNKCEESVEVATLFQYHNFLKQGTTSKSGLRYDYSSCT